MIDASRHRLEIIFSASSLILPSRIFSFLFFYIIFSSLSLSSDREAAGFFSHRATIVAERHFIYVVFLSPCQRDIFSSAGI